MSIVELASSSVVFALLQPAPATFSCLSPADSLYVTVTFGPSVSESLFQVSFHWCSGLTAGHRESSLHPQRPTPPSLTSGNFYSCHMLSQMTQLSLQLPSRHSAPSSHLASRPSPIFLSPAAPVFGGQPFFFDCKTDFCRSLTNKLELSLHLNFKLQNLPRSSKTQSPPCLGLYCIGFPRPCSADLFYFLLCFRGVTQDHQAARRSVRLWWPAQREECSCQQHLSSCQRHK